MKLCAKEAGCGTEKKRNICKILAKGGRVLTVPPILATVFLLVLWYCGGEVYHNITEFVFSVFFLGIMPVLTYAVHFTVPFFREGGRTLQRTMAFVFTFAGYLAAFLYGIFTNVGAGLQMIYCAYFFAVILLSVMNYIFKKKASGHASSFIEPAIILFLFTLPGWAVLFIVIVIGMVSVWSSLHLKRHQPKELFWGGCCSVAAAILSVLVYGRS